MKKKINKMLHHIIYAFNGVGKHEQIDIKVPIFTTEHHILTELQRRGKIVSKGFLQALKYFIWERETTGNFVDLKMEKQNENTDTSKSSKEKILPEIPQQSN